MSKNSIKGLNCYGGDKNVLIVKVEKILEGEKHFVRCWG